MLHCYRCLWHTAYQSSGVGGPGFFINPAQILYANASTNQGAQYIGYHNPVTDTPTTVQAQLDQIVSTPSQNVYITTQQLIPQSIPAGGSYSYPIINYTPHSASSTIEVEYVGNWSSSGNIGVNAYIAKNGLYVPYSNATFTFSNNTQNSIVAQPFAGKYIFSPESTLPVSLQFVIYAYQSTQTLNVGMGWLTIKEYT